MQSEKKDQARILRKKGYSIGEISRLVSSPPTTVFYWIKDEKLSEKAKVRLEKVKNEGRKFGRDTLKKARLEAFQIALEENTKVYSAFDFSPEQCRFFCSLLYWAEGAKSESHLGFTNSDPEMIKAFLFFLRRGFDIDESKLRGLIHLHEYHDPRLTLKLWSSVTGIPESQFSKPYVKPHTGKSKHENYPGCVRIRYYDATIYQALKLIYAGLAAHLRGVS